MWHPSSSSLEASDFCANQIAKYGRTGCGVTGFGIKIYKHAWLLDRWESKAASMYSWSVSWSTNFPVYLSSLRHRTNFFWSFTEFFFGHSLSCTYFHIFSKKLCLSCQMPGLLQAQGLKMWACNGPVCIHQNNYYKLLSHMISFFFQVEPNYTLNLEILKVKSV